MTFFFLSCPEAVPTPCPTLHLVLARTVPHQREGEGGSQEVSGLFASSPSSRQAKGLLFPPVQSGLTSHPAPGEAGRHERWSCFPSHVHPLSTSCVPDHSQSPRLQRE